VLEVVGEDYFFWFVKLDGLLSDSMKRTDI